jgi:hypothetical protein
MKNMCVVSQACSQRYIPKSVSVVEYTRKKCRYEFLYSSAVRGISRCLKVMVFLLVKKTPWSESANELYRPSDCRLSAK